MSEPSDATPTKGSKPRQPTVSQDRGLKALAFTRTLELLEALVPKLFARRGRPVSAQPLPQELHRHDLTKPSILLDIAVVCTWADGSQEIIILIEHYSEARKVVLIHVHQYYAELVARYQPVRVLPMVFITDPSDRDVQDSWDQEIDGTTYATFKVELIRLGPRDTHRLRQLRTVSSSVLLALTFRDSIDAAVEMGMALDAVSVSLDVKYFYFSLGLELARIKREDVHLLRRRFKELSPMANTVLDEWLIDAKAEGKAEGKLESILQLVSKGRLTIDVARAEIEDLVIEGTITRVQADATLATLG